MKTSSQLLLTFLLNACWQTALVAALASFSSWLLSNSAARYRHWIWVGALFLSLGIPLTTSSRVLSESFQSARAPVVEQATTQSLALATTQPTRLNEQFQSGDAFLLSRTVALVLIGIYCAIIFYGLFRLVHAWYVTRRLRLSSLELGEHETVSRLVEKCAIAIPGTSEAVPVRSSETVQVPITLGIFNPIIILPRELLIEGNDEMLTSAIGHELIHVRRRDYALNLAYELLYLPLSFHPAAALIRRRIRQTRELSCDELVAERILKAEVYARSLVKLASSAPPLRRLSVTTTVGIADADILEARIMSLLRRPKMDTRRKRMLLIAVSLLLLVPCIAAASFAMKFDLRPSEPGAAAQEPTQQEKESREKAKREDVRRTVGVAITENEMKERMQDPRFREELDRKQEIELEARAIRQAALLKIARISMDQAIQIATSQQPGKVLECSLDGEHWEEPGKLAKDGYVFYHVVIVSGDDADESATNHVLVNAVDGSIIRNEKELLRKKRRAEP